MTQIVRTTVGAGRWFPSESGVLRRDLESYIVGCPQPPEPIEKRICCVIVPHAGYRYSGRIAGYCFRAVRDQIAAHPDYKPDVVVVIGFSHSMSHSGAVLMDGDILRSPIHDSRLDKESSDFLCTLSNIRYDYRYHNGEHSAENEVPFVQFTLPDTPLVVALVGDQRGVQSLSEGLVQLSQRKRVLVVCSTDMLHDEDYEKVNRTDAATLEHAANLDTAWLMRTWEPSHQIFCGIKAVITGMNYAKALGCPRAIVLKHACSGDDAPGERDYNVGYGAIVIPLP
eukprot:GAFH01003496.1.p1 GENE.GAFH01003496.1~~GAFH01003496.1.p1  ORF type:complete len:290 (+),score=12.04 GAFH01003496.1:22-870(+)